MKIFFALWLAILLATSNVIAHAAVDSLSAQTSKHYDRALLVVPQGAAITEIIPTRTSAWGMATIYVKYVFEMQCYLLISGPKRMALTTVQCG